MKTFLVCARIEVDVVISIKAKAPEDAEMMFNDHVILNADLIDVEKKNYLVEDDSIVEIRKVTVEEVG